MSKQQLKLFVLPGILLAFVLAVMQWFGDQHGLFIQNLWYDKVMHIFGGAGACSLAFWCFANLSDGRKWFFLHFGLPLVGLIAGLIIGSFWEWAEWCYPVMTAYIPQTRWDTFFDVLFDCIGGHVAGTRYQRIWRWQKI